MKVLLLLCLLPLGTLAGQTVDMSKVRSLYHKAPTDKKVAMEFSRLMQPVDSVASAPVLICYKGASEMIQAKYTVNPIVKLEKLNKGKSLIKKAIGLDTLNVEMRFIRYSIQSNLPAFLGYNGELAGDKRFLLLHTKYNKDRELKEMIFYYFSEIMVIKQEELKQLKN